MATNQQKKPWKRWRVRALFQGLRNLLPGVGGLAIAMRASPKLHCIGRGWVRLRPQWK